MMNTLELEPRLQKLIDLGESGTDILHGELKNLMYQTETNIVSAQNGEPLEENEYDESDDYLNGMLDAYTHVYQLTYALAFAIDERTKARG